MVTDAGRRQRELVGRLKREQDLRTDPTGRVTFPSGGGDDLTAIARAKSIREAQIQEAEAVAEAKAEATRQAEVKEQKRIAEEERREQAFAGTIEGQLGAQAVGGSFEFVGGVSRFIERPGVTRNIGESEASFRARQESLGRGILGSSPGLAEQIFEQQALEVPTTREESIVPISEVRPRPSRFAQAREFFFGETGERFTGISSFPLFGISTATPQFTFREIKTGLAGTGFAGEVVSEIIPTTPIGTAAVVSTPAVFRFLSPAIRTAVTSGFGVLGTTTALDKELTTAQRTAGGIVGGLAFLGATAELSPFIKGGIARLSPRFRGVKGDQFVTTSKLAPRGIAEVIPEVKTLTPGETVDVQLIPPGRGFGFTRAEQEAFIGKRVEITTSARDLIKGTGEVKVAEGEEGLGLFFTPSLERGIPQARVSRLGLTDFFKAPKGDVSLGFAPSRPQIVFLRDVPIAKKGAPGTARGLGFPSGELEVTLLPGTEITGKLTGRTSIKGQKVDIFEAVLGKGKDVFSPVKVDIPGLRTRGTADFLPTQTILGGAGTRGLADPFRTRELTTQARTPISPRAPTGKKEVGGEPKSPGFFLPQKPSDFFPRGQPNITGLGDPFAPSRPPTQPRRLALTQTQIGDIFRFEDDPFRERFPKRRKADDGRKEKKKKKPPKAKRRRIAPSLTGISRFQFGGITGKLPTGKGTFGVLPSQIRFVPA